MPGIVKSKCVNFDGDVKISTTVGYNGFLIKDNSSAGTPTYAGSADGLKLTLAANDELEVVTLYTGDVLFLEIARLEKIIFRDVKVSASFADGLVIGLGSAQNDTQDSFTNNCWFKLAGSNALVCESDDGTTDVDDKATGITLSTTALTLEIDFTTEVYSASKGLSKGQQATFWVTDANGVRRRVAESVAFNLAAQTAAFQPLIQIQKASGATTPNVTVRDIEMYWRSAS
jgi:hypothetical protein